MALRWVILLLLIAQISFGQECSITVQGSVKDISSHETLEYANIYVKELQTGTVTDEEGNFKLENLCAGGYHFLISHIGCEAVDHYIIIERDTFLNIHLHHHLEMLDELIVHGSSEPVEGIKTNSVISANTIVDNSNKNLADILDDIQGVSSLKTGSNISKPIIHGLSGNRIVMQNNGLVQKGQQWGNDHSPEIDPFTANHIAVIKGASSLEYAANALGGVILIESGKIKEDPHLHGLVNYKLQSNGLGHTLNARLKKYSSWGAWRVSGSAKLSGDHKSPDYFLTNTGRREFNAAANYQNHFGKKLFLDAYYSVFYTELGVLRGAHISNLTDLKEAFLRDEPFLTKDHFSYAFESPKQQVIHHLVKVALEHQLKSGHSLTYKYGSQFNSRKEFDIRRANRSDIPALSLQLQNHIVETSFLADLEHGMRVKTGIKFDFTDNSNNPETGVLPLIPDYRSTISSAFIIFKQVQNRFAYELGGRYNFETLEAITISRTPPREIERFNHIFHNYSFLAGVKANLFPSYKFNVEIGYSQRNPEINELYSNGLHQGVSGIEEGNRDLQAEKAMKLISTQYLNISDYLSLEATAYFQHFNNYIYLQLQDELRLTVRGAFPVFRYTSTKANLAGLDLMAKADVHHNFSLLFKYALVRGKDVINDLAINYLPSDNFTAGMTYAIKDGKKFKNNTIGLEGEYVFKQKHVEDEVISDGEEEIRIAPPNGYFLLHLKAATECQLKKSSLKFGFSIENMLNRSYRNYLNRHRYFADDTGIDIGWHITYVF